MARTYIYKDNLGKLIKRNRKAWGMGKFKFAYLIGEEFDFVENLESGKIKNISLNLLLRIADVLQVNMYDFIRKDVSDNEILKWLD